MLAHQYDMAHADAIVVAFALLRGIDFLPFLVKDSVNWKLLKVNCKDLVKKNILKIV